jgi:hypothetical protein
MEPLPTFPTSCALDEPGALQQAGRYRDIGAGAAVLKRDPGLLVVELDGAIDAALVEETIEIERKCCPFFAIDYARTARRLSFSVASPAQLGAIDAIAFALGVEDG